MIENQQMYRNDEAVSAGSSPSHHGLMLGLVLTGMFVNLLNVSVINVMLPTLMDRFTVSVALAQWASTGFLLLTGIVIALVPFLVKRYRYKTLFVAAMAALVVGSIVCAAAPGFAWLLVGRLIQAIGYGILLPLAMILVLAVTPPERLGSAMGVLGVAMMLAPAVGPTIAGVVITVFSWRVLFAAMAVIGTAVGVAALVGFSYRQPTSRPRPDLAGIALVAGGLSALLYGASRAGQAGWADPVVLIALITGLGLLAGFVVVELRGDHPLLDVRVLADRVFARTVAITMVLQMAFYGGLILMPLYFQKVLGLSGLQTGLLVLPGSAVIGLLGLVAGKVYDRIGLKPLAVAGGLVMAGAALALARLSPASHWWYALVAYTVFAVGVAAISTPITTAAFATVAASAQSDAATVQNMLRQIAGAMGTAVIMSTVSMAAASATTAGQTPALATAHGVSVAFELTAALALVTAVAAAVWTTGRRPTAGH